MLPLSQAYGLTTTTIALGATAVPTGAAASFLTDLTGVVGWQLYPTTGATVFVGSPAITNGLSLAAVGAVLPQVITTYFGPIRFQLAAGAAAASVSVTKLLNEGFSHGSSQSPGL